MRRSTFFHTCICLLLISGFIVALRPAKAQEATAVSTRRTELEKALADLEAQIATQKTTLATQQKQRASLERDIAILNNKIATAKLSIKARNLAIEGLTKDIGGKKVVISGLDSKIEKEKESLAELLRKTNEIDAYSEIEVLLSGKNVSEFFADLDSFKTIKTAVNASYTTIKSVKETTEEEKSALEGKLNEEVALRKLQELEAKKIQKEETEKKYLVIATKGLESEYQKIIVSKEKNASAIRTELFTLQGSSAITFEKALEHAKRVSAATGVRPAFILGIIAEESNLGENVGTGNWRVDMKNPRDTEPFLKITSSLGLDPDKMPVSKKPWYGYGGAMGPAQFIPSTWVLYIDRIAAATGHNPPNPWDPVDAFTAASILLKDNGAIAGNLASERLAALRYLAGWANANKRAYAFYGDDVMELAEKYQRQINILGG